jgi:hypothetical protein
VNIETMNDEKHPPSALTASLWNPKFPADVGNPKFASFGVFAMPRTKGLKITAQEFTATATPAPCQKGAYTLTR